MKGQGDTFSLLVSEIVHYALIVFAHTELQLIVY